MPGPKPPALVLSDEQCSLLEKLVARHSSAQQLVKRARLILYCADGLNNSQIARLLSTDPDAIRFWRNHNHWLGLEAVPLKDLSVEEHLADAHRSGKPSAITSEQFCQGRWGNDPQIVALACQLPEQSGRPITHWSPRELAAEIVKRGILASISPRHAARLLKKGISRVVAPTTPSRIECVGG